MSHSEGLSATRPRRRGPAAALAVVATAALCVGAPGVPLGGCGGAPQTAPTSAASPQATSVSPHPSGASPQATGSAPAGGPSPVPVVTAGPVPPDAARVAVRFWRLLDAHRYAALLGVLAPDSQAAGAMRAGRAAAFWGIDGVRVVSVDATVGRTPPMSATLEFAMTIDVRPSGATAWRAGRNLVFMSLRRVGGSWLIYETGSGP